MKARIALLAILTLGVFVIGSSWASAETAPATHQASQTLPNGNKSRSDSDRRAAPLMKTAAQCIKQNDGGCDPTPCGDDEVGCQSDCCAGSICVGMSVIGGTGGYMCVDPSEASAIQKQAEICGWYALGGCTASEADAKAQAAKIDPFQVLHTDDVPGLGTGQYCLTNGPTTQSNAIFDQKTLQEAGIADASVIEACNEE